MRRPILHRFDHGELTVLVRRYADAALGQALRLGSDVFSESPSANRIEERAPLVRAPTLVARGARDR